MKDKVKALYEQLLNEMEYETMTKAGVEMLDNLTGIYVRMINIENHAEMQKQMDAFESAKSDSTPNMPEGLN